MIHAINNAPIHATLKLALLLAWWSRTRSTHYGPMSRLVMEALWSARR
jgi:hypothetical protein